MMLVFTKDLIDGDFAYIYVLLRKAILYFLDRVSRLADGKNPPPCL